MGVSNRYLGHVDIDPPLSQAEYDQLVAVSRGQVRLADPDEIEPWCPWEPCPHGCCLRWSGSDCYGTGAEGLQLLIDRFLSSDHPPGSFADSGLAGFTFDHDTNGVIAGETEARGLFLVRVESGTVRTEMLVRDDPMAWETDRRLPWLSSEPSPDEQRRLANEAVLAKLRSEPPRAPAMMGGSKGRTRRSSKAKGS